MHLYFIARGILQQVKLFEMFMQTQMYIWKRKNLKTKKIEVIQVQGALRQCAFGIYEYVFPKENLDEILTVLEPATTHSQADLGKLRPFILRRMIGHKIKKVPEFKKVLTNRYIESRGVLVYLIGIKEDEVAEQKGFGYEQELL